MKSTSGFWSAAAGPALAAATAASLEVLTRSGVAVPELPLLLLPGVLIAALSGSLFSTGIAVLIASLYAGFALYTPGFDPTRLGTWIVAYPLLGLTVAILHRRGASAAAARERDVLDSSSPSVWITDEDGRTGYANDAFRREYPDAPTSAGNTRVDNDLEVIAGGRPMEILESYGAGASGTEHWLVYRFPLPPRDGRRRVGAIAFDTSERARAEDGLRQREALVRKVLDACPEAAILLDSKYRIRTWNGRAEALLGWSPSEAKSLAFESILATAQRQTVMTQIEAIQASEGGSLRLESRALQRDLGEFPAELHIHPIVSGKSRFLGVYLRDLSESRTQEQQVRQLRKMEAMGRLAGGVAHDFNNLLTAILGYGTMLRKGLPENHALKDCVDEILHSGRRAADLTRQLLAFSRKQVMDPKVMDLNHVVREMEKMLRRLIGEHIRFETTLGLDLGSVRADYGQIEQVIMNLAVNARDAMPDGGTLAIRTSNVDVSEADAARNADARPGPFVMLVISDTGLGIEPAARTHLFEPFFTTKGEGKGTGLGLSTVYGIVKQSGGFIRLHSEKNQGTTFEIFLPRAAERVAVADEDSKSNQSAVRGGETVLVVEDSDTVRSLAVRILKTKGYTVLEASNGQEALQVSRGHPGRIDLLLTDVIMPGMNGQTVARHLKDQRKRIKVLFTSGYPGDAFGGMEGLGGDASFLQKPFTPYTLGNKVREVLDTSGSSSKMKSVPAR